MLNMLRRLDRIRFRGHRRDDFLDLAESPNASDTECGDEGPLRAPRTSPRDSEELRDPVSAPCGVPSTCPRPPGSRRAVPHPQAAGPSLASGRLRPAQLVGDKHGLLLPSPVTTSPWGSSPDLGSDGLPVTKGWSGPWVSPSAGVFWVAGWSAWPRRGVCR